MREAYFVLRLASFCEEAVVFGEDGRVAECVSISIFFSMRLSPRLKFS